MICSNAYNPKCLALLVGLGLVSGCLQDRPVIDVPAEAAGHSAMMPAAMLAGQPGTRPTAPRSSSAGASGGAPAARAEVKGFSCEGAATPQRLSDMDYVSGIALAPDTILFATADALFSMPKGSRSAPKQLRELFDGSRLAVLDDKLIYMNLEARSIRFDGSEDASIAGSPSLRYTNRLTHDAKGAYASETSCGAESVLVIPRKGEPQTISVDCPQGMAWQDGVGYFFTGDDDTHTLVRIVPGKEPETLATGVAANADTDDMAATDEYLYFWVNDAFESSPSMSGQKGLARIPLTGGEVEVIKDGPGSGATMIAVSDDEIAFQTNDDPSTCVGTFNEATDTFKVVASLGYLWQMAADETGFYFADNSLSYVPR